MEGMLAPMSTMNGAFFTPRSRIVVFFSGQPLVERVLHVGGELARFVDLVLQCDLLHQVAELVDRLFADRIFAGGDFQGVGWRIEVEVVGLDAARRGILAGVGVDGDEQIGLMLIGDGGARLQRNEGVVVAGVDDVGAQLALQQPAQAQRDVEHQIFFQQAVGADGSGVVAAVTGIDDDASDLQAESANQRALAVGGGLSLANLRIARILLVGGSRRACPGRAGRPPARWARRWACRWPSAPDR